MNRRKLYRVECRMCGYTLRVTMSTLTEQGVPPTCVCGEPLIPLDPGLAILAGRMELSELPRRERTKLCHRMGWQDAIVRTSPSQEPGRRRRSRIVIREEMPF